MLVSWVIIVASQIHVALCYTNNIVLTLSTFIRIFAHVQTTKQQHFFYYDKSFVIPAVHHR